MKMEILIETLNNKRELIRNSISDLIETQNECASRGHEEGEILSKSYRGINCLCKSCGEIYTRKMNSKEQKEFYNLTNNVYFSSVKK